MKTYARYLRIAPVAALVFVSLLFFYKTILLGKLPFPGDLLLSGYTPWRHESYNGYVAGAIPSKDQYFDVIRELYPWRTLVNSEIRHGSAPLWNPYNFSGAPLLANYQSQVFYPLSALYLILPQHTAWTVMVVLQGLLGTLFTYLFATEIGLTAAAAVFTSLLFNFSSFASVWSEFTTVWHTVLWLPLMLYIIERAVKRKHMLLSEQGVLIFALFSAITGGHPQDFLNSFIFFVIYTTARILTMQDWTVRRKLIFLAYPLAFLAGISFAVAGMQLLPAMDLFSHSARVAHDYLFTVNSMLIQVWQLPLLAVGEFFGNPATKSNSTGDFVGKTLSVGITGFAMAVAGLWSTFRKKWHKTFFFATAVFLLLITVRSPVTEFLYRYPLPVLATGTPTRILFLFIFAWSMLAGFGFDGIFSEKFTRIKTIATVSAILIVLWTIAVLHPAFPGVQWSASSIAATKKAMMIATGVFFVISAVSLLADRKKPLILLVILLSVGELFYNFIKFNPFVPASFIFPENRLISFLQAQKGINRVWGYGTAEMEANFATQTRLFSPEGTDPLNLSWYNRFLQSSKDGRIARSFNRTTRSDAKLASGYGETDLPSNTYRLRVMDMLGVRYIIDRAENPKNNNTFALNRFSIVWSNGEWTVYENAMAAPRYFLTTDVRGYQNDADFEKQFFSESFIPSRSVLMEYKDQHTVPKLIPAASGDVQLIGFQPTEVQFKTRTETQQLLFFSDTFDEGWKAYVNGTETPVYKTNYAFRSVLVPSGSSLVTFIYKPDSFTNGLRLSTAAAIVLVFYMVLYAIHTRRKH